MKKHIFAGVIAFAIFPCISFAQATDVDTSGNASCAVISVNLRYLSRDSGTNGAVSVLQDFLNSKGYLSSQPTGFFGSMTRTAVIAFQTANGISATPAGFVGSTTRVKIQEIDCGTTDGTVSDSANANLTSSSTNGGLTSSVNDLQAYLSRLIAQVATLQAQIKDPSATNTNTNNSTPSITFSGISSGNAIGSFANLPANSQIRFVNSSTAQAYTGQSTMVSGGGSGQLSITVPNDLPNGTYYLRVTDYYNPNITIAQSASFQAGSNVQTNSVIINSFNASPSSVNAGGAVMFMWSSNLTSNDISYYGGGCNIEGITQNNVAVYVTSGFKSASGQITFVPPATATYTLRCTSNAKDGSPSASRQITINVAQPQTNPVIISLFNTSQTSVSSGQPVTFSWNSNLTSNDISYYGGFCNIEGLGNNTALYVSTGKTSGASGSITYTPAFTATYTLRCSAGRKDSSPMDSKQVTVNVN